MVTQRQASSLLFLNADQTAEHGCSIKELVEDTQYGAFLEPEERDTFQIFGEPTRVGLGNLNPAYRGLVFPGSEPEKPDLSSLVEDLPQELRERILLKVEESHKANLERNKAMDEKFRALYSSTTGAINDFSEVVRGYGKVSTALDLCMQGIIRRSGPVIKATSVATPTRSK